MMKIAACVTEDGSVGTPFSSGSVCVFERRVDSWVREREIAYAPLSTSGIAQARGFLRDIAGRIGECEVFLVAELQGFTHVWLEELGFRTWKSEGTLMEQLERVAELDGKAEESKRQSALVGCDCGSASSCGTVSCSSGCGGGCGGRVNVPASADFGAVHPVPEPLPVGNPSDRRYSIDLAAILELDPALNSRQVIIPFLEKKKFNEVDIHFDHLPKWFYQTLEDLGLLAEISVSLPPAHGLEARITRSA